MQNGRNLHNVRAEAFDTPALQLFGASLENRKRTLQVVSAVKYDEKLAAIGEERDHRVVCSLGQTHPQCIGRSAKVLNRQARAVSNHGIPAIGPNDEIRADFYGTGRSVAPNARNPVLIFDQPADL